MASVPAPGAVIRGLAQSSGDAVQHVPTVLPHAAAALKATCRFSGRLDAVAHGDGALPKFQAADWARRLIGIKSRMKTWLFEPEHPPGRCLIRAIIGLGMAFVVALPAGCMKRPANCFQGYIEGEYVYVASPLGGALTNLAVARGDSVAGGQFLFELERQSEAAALEQAEKNLAQARAQLADLIKGQRPSEIASREAQLESAKASLKLSAVQLARREQLSGTDVISREELDQARAQNEANRALVNQLTADLETAHLGGRDDAIRAAEANVASQQAALDKAKWAFAQKQQFAPAAALVHDTLYRAGEFVGAGSPVVALLPPENLKVRFFVPQDKLPRINIGERVSVHPDGAMRAFDARVNYISTQAEYTPPVIYSRETRAKLVFMIEARFSPADSGELRPGQPVDVQLP